MIVIGSLILAVYFLTLSILIIGYRKVDDFNLKPEKKPITGFSVLIAFRNEAENLPDLLNSLKQLDYPTHLFEIIFINDDSKDNSVEIIQNELKNSPIVYQIIENQRFSDAPKKDALHLGVKKSNFEWIFTTDADCMLPSKLLLCYNAFIKTHSSVLIAGPVKYSQKKGFLYHFQDLENRSLQTVTVGSFGLKKPLLCNGANLTYKKTAFYKVGGFKGNNHIASGDDIFLLEKMKEQFPNSVHFIKSRNAIVITKPQKTWAAIIHQRVRWTSKTSKQKSITTMFLGIVLFLCNLFLVVGCIFSFFQFQFFIFLLVFLFLKMVLDFIFILRSSLFFQTPTSVKEFLLSSLCYPFISVFVVIKSISGNYLWKDRKY